MKHPHKILSLITRLSATVDCLLDITDMIPNEHLHSEHCRVLEGNRCSCDFQELRDAGRNEVREAQAILRNLSKQDITLTTASGDIIKMDAETAGYLASPDHLVRMLTNMGQGELASWMQQQDIAADALEFEVRSGLADRQTRSVCQKITTLPPPIKAAA